MKRLIFLLTLSLWTQWAFSQLVITEIMYNPDSAESTNETQYVELVNVSSMAVNVDGWELGDSQDDEWNLLPNVTVPAFGILVVFGSSEAEFTAAWGNAIDPGAVLVSVADLSQTMFNLSNSPSPSNETVAIRDVADVIIDEVNFDDTSPWPSDSPDGPSIYLNRSSQDVLANGAVLNDDGSNWASSNPPTDGAVNNVMTTVWNGVDSGSPGNFLGDGALSAFIVINEVDAETPNGDTEEFIEIIGPANTPLDGYVLVLFSGATDTSYDAIDLDGLAIGPTGFFVVCVDASAVENCDLDVMETSQWLADGADAVALYQADASDFPNGTPVTATDIVDAVVYDTDDADDAGLLSVLTPGQPQINEAGGGASLTEAIARVPDGGLPLETGSYVAQVPTPGISNLSILGIKINEYVANHAGMDQREFVEILGDPNTDISQYWVLQIEGDAEDNPGRVHAVIQCGSTNSLGLWFSGFSEDVLGNTSMTLMLVDGFTGLQDDDLDTDDDGVLDITPWSAVMDALAVNDSDIGDQTYATVLFTPGFDGDIFAPGGLSRIPHGMNTGQTSDWKRNNFSGAGIPGYSGTVQSNEAANTPNEPNGLIPSVSAVINEFVSHHVSSTKGPATDDHEYVEVFGDAVTDYGAFSILQIDGDQTANPGQVLSAYSVGMTDIAGLWQTGFLTEELQDGSLTLLLVKGFNGMVNDDLDTDNDGVLDVQPWTLIHDGVGRSVVLGDRIYATTVLDDAFDALLTVPDGASRVPHGLDTDSVSDWLRNDFDGAGLPGFPGSLVMGEALNTPGLFNVTTQTASSAAVINEFVANHTGSDDHEYVEIFGAPDTNYSQLWILSVEGDLTDNPGKVDAFWQVGQTNADGYWTGGFRNNVIENSTMTLMLVEGFSGPPGVDLDGDDDGVLDLTPWTTLVDDVGVQDDGLTDPVYSTSLLAQGFDGITFTVGGASRFPDGMDTNTVGDWLRNDFSGEGLPGFMGGLDPGEALNTPDAENSDMLPPGTGAILSEFVIDHVGIDTHQFIEIFGMPQRSYHTTWILVVDGDVDGNPGHIDLVFQGGLLGSAGLWDTGYLDQVIPIGSQSLLLVEDFTGMAGDDLDTNDDGVLDLEPWSVLADDIAIDDGDAGDLSYSAVLLDASKRGLGGFMGSASRIPYGIDNDVTGDWRVNDFDGAGLDGFGGDLEPGEAYNTRGFVNRVGVVNGDYYATADISDSTLMRSSLHAIIQDHVYFPYTSDFTDTWDILEMADEDPTNPSNVLTIYKNASYVKEGGGNMFYNREHSWPKSYGFPDDEFNAYPYTDLHHLRLSDSIYNSTRNNISFGTCNAGCGELPTDVNNGQGGGMGVYPGNSNWHAGSGGNGIFEVWHDRRGDIARSLIYLDVRYEGGLHGVTGAPEPDLVLTDDIGLIQTTGVNGSLGYMGRLSVLQQWHEEDPVSPMERLRNDILYLWQGNRNPFVDHPEWVDCLYGDCLTTCITQNLSTWFVDASVCGVGVTSVLDFVSMQNGTCVCN